MNIEGFAIVKELSRGPITTVYLGKQLALERPVLIKILNTQWQNESDLLERFRREAIICARLKHPNIVNIFDVSTDPKNLYLIIEFLEGEDLEAFIRKHHPLPFEIILHLSKEILNGLTYAHSQWHYSSGHQTEKYYDRPRRCGKNYRFRTRQGSRFAGNYCARRHCWHAGIGRTCLAKQATGAVVGEQSDIFSLGATIQEWQPEFHFSPEKILAESIQKVLDKIIPRCIKPVTILRSGFQQWLQIC